MGRILFISLQVNIPYRSGTTKNYYINTPRRKHMSKALARGSKKSVVEDCFKDPKIHMYLKKKIGRVLKSEIKSMCSNKVNSILRSTSSCKNLTKFKWSYVIDELKVHAPLLFDILVSCIPLNGANSQAIICMCSSLIFSNHFKHMNLIQKIISLILYAGRAGKQVRVSHCTCILNIEFVFSKVYSRLHKLNVTISSSSITNLITTLGQNFDGLVKDIWKNSQLPFLVVRQLLIIIFAIAVINFITYTAII
ncbi:hypothetical protein SPONN_108 [uncultured Candidatus Thioglobus sp.]|nr:hypothetical protein SPONN_108 [uncultured Candidatus Thioglobus sp.]